MEGEKLITMVNKAVSAITTRLHSMYINVMLLINSNCIIGVMVSVLTWSAGDLGFEPRSSQLKDCFCCFSEERAKNNWLGIRIICPSGSTCPPSSILESG
jgi:hypothetical protein